MLQPDVCRSFEAVSWLHLSFIGTRVCVRTRLSEAQSNSATWQNYGAIVAAVHQRVPDPEKLVERSQSPTFMKMSLYYFALLHSANYVATAYSVR